MAFCLWQVPSVGVTMEELMGEAMREVMGGTLTIPRSTVIRAGMGHKLSEWRQAHDGDNGHSMLSSGLSSLSMPQEKSMTELSISPRAAQQIQHKGGVLRVRVLAGGCSGLRYVFTIEPHSNPDDHIFHDHGACVVTDALSWHFIQGSTVDYREELMVSQFVMINPKADHACGCGESFSVS